MVRRLLLLSGVISLTGFALGLVLSFMINIPAGAGE